MAKRKEITIEQRSVADVQIKSLQRDVYKRQVWHWPIQILLS